MIQLVKPDINIDFVGRFRSFGMVSMGIIAACILMLVANLFIPGRGSVLNFGTDFRGGSQVQVEFGEKVDSGQVRSALEDAGFKGGEVVAITDDPNRPYFFMLRMSEVSAYSPEDRQRAEQVVKTEIGDNFTEFEYRDEESDRVYVHLKRGILTTPELVRQYRQRVDEAFVKAGLAVQQVQLFGRPDNATYEVALGGLAQELRAAFEDAMGAGAVKDIPSVESVGAKAGRQLRNDGIKAVLYAMLFILLYVALRFDFRFAPGGIVAVFHDVLITLGIFAALWIEFSLPIVAALLTIAGYSINDTIVVFDRMQFREAATRYRDKPFPAVVNKAINETLSRTILTSATTIITSSAIWFFGSGAIKTFALALTLGVAVGTYSSIFIASPVVLWLSERFGRIKT